jgi:hypothetical protein
MTSRTAPPGEPLRCPACGSAKVRALVPCDGFVTLRCRSCAQMWSLSATAGAHETHVGTGISRPAKGPTPPVSS